MAIDFGRIGTTNVLDTATDPMTLFNALPRSTAAYGYLRSVQAEVLQKWYSRRTDRDIVIKMNTGAGKTVVGLLLLKSCLNERVAPAAYITPDNYLASQVRDEARKLGISVTEEIDNNFLSGRAILVDNFHTIVNGRSKFGIYGRTPLGSVVVDDAHSCLRIAEEKFTITLPAAHDAYQRLLAIFRPALEQQSLAGAMGITDGDPTKILQVPWWEWREKIRQVTEILHRNQSSKELEWAWPLLQDALPNCTCVFSGQAMSVSSRCLNIGLIRDFEAATRRVYMTATLADDSSLVSHLHVVPSAVGTPVTPSSASDLGDRMILAPQQLNAAITDDEVRAFLGHLAKYINVVVIVPSGARAEAWAGVASQILVAANLTEGVEKLRKGLVGLTVLVNKYDGVDLPHDACRVLVIDGLPEVNRCLDRIDSSMLENSETMLAKHVQRIEQGMGRGIRSNDDHCLVLLLGARLVQRLGTPVARSSLTAPTRAQLELSERIADQLRGKTLNEIYDDAMALCLKQDPRWVQVSRAAVAQISYDIAAPASPRTVCLREAFDAALLDRYADAAAAVRRVVEAERDEHVKGWLLQQVADYTHVFNPSAAQQTQVKAQTANRQALKPISGVVYVKISAARPQAGALATFLQTKYSNANDLLIGYNAFLDDLVFQPNSFRQFEAAVQEMGEHLGFVAHRPELEFGKGPDNLWALGNTQFAMIECKNEATADQISKEYVDKSSGRRNWFNDTYGPGCKAESLIVHPSRVVSIYASPEPGLRVVTPTKLEELKAACRTLARGIAQSRNLGDVPAIVNALNELGLLGSQIVSRYSEAFVMAKA